jgi:hypothetical protein
VAAFQELDRLLFIQQWPVDGGEFPPMTVSKTLIDSGGTQDRMLEASRTVQVYNYVIPRQPPHRPSVIAIKGAARPGAGMFWPMKNPMAGGTRNEWADLKALMIDRHQANDLLAEMMTAGIPSEQPRAEGPAAEQWMLNRRDDDVYNAHMAAMQRTVDPRTRAEIWTPRTSGAPHDYRDCEAYEVIAAYLENVHLLPPETDVIAMKRQQLAMSETRSRPQEPQGGDPWAVRPL